MRIEILGWASYNPRTDLKTMRWFRLQSDIGMSKKLFGLGAEQKWLWVFLLSEAAKQNKGGIVDIDLSYLAFYAGVEEALVEEAFQHFTSKKLAKIDPSHDQTPDGPDQDPDESVRDPNESVTNPIESVPNITEQNITEDITGDPAGAGPVKAKKKPKAKEPGTDGSRVFAAYSEAIRTRYGHDAPKGAKAYAQTKKLVDLFGVETATELVRFYVRSNDPWYGKMRHTLGPCLSNAEAIYSLMQSAKGPKTDPFGGRDLAREIEEGIE